MIPLILESENEEKTSQYLKDNQLDKTLVYELNRQDSLKIEDVRDLIHLLSLASIKDRTLLIRNADNLTVPAQNALLKTLEEQKSKDQVVLSLRTKYSLLETILSRCNVVSLLGNQTEEVSDPASQKILQTITKSPSEIIPLTDELLKNDPESVILNFIKILRHKNQEHPTVIRMAIIKLALTCLNDLKHNLNPKLAIDHFLLKSNQLIKMKPANA
jgi:galactose-1-phosphate uridylyltransferase